MLSWTSETDVDVGGVVEVLSLVVVGCASCYGNCVDGEFDERGMTSW